MTTDARCFDLPVINAEPPKPPSMAEALASVVGLAVIARSAALAARRRSRQPVQPAPVALVRCWSGHLHRADMSCCPQCGGLPA